MPNLIPVTPRRATQTDVERILELLEIFHPIPENRYQWLTTHHKELEDHTPLLLILGGRAGVVCDLLEGSYAGLPT
jgi:hypothetical protein